MKTVLFLIVSALISKICAEIDTFAAITEVRWAPTASGNSGNWIITASSVVGAPARILELKSSEVSGANKDRLVSQKVNMEKQIDQDPNVPPIYTTSFHFTGCTAFEAAFKLTFKLCADESEPCQKVEEWSPEFNAASGNACEIRGIVGSGDVPDFVRQQMLETEVEQRKQKGKEGYVVMDPTLSGSPFGNMEVGVAVPSNDSEVDYDKQEL